MVRLKRVKERRRRKKRLSISYAWREEWWGGGRRGTADHNANWGEDGKQGFPKKRLVLRGGCSLEEIGTAGDH